MPYEKNDDTTQPGTLFDAAAPQIDNTTVLYAPSSRTNAAISHVPSTRIMHLEPPPRNGSGMRRIIDHCISNCIVLELLHCIHYYIYILLHKDMIFLSLSF